MKAEEFPKPAEADFDEFDEELEEFDELDESEMQEFKCYMTEQAEADDLEHIQDVDPEARDNPAKLQLIETAIREGHCKLVTHEGQIMAYGIFDYSAQGGKHGCVKLIHVIPEQRRDGVGSDMLMGFESTCETSKIYASVPQDNLAAQELFKSVDYRVAKEPKSPGADILFVKNIWEPPSPRARDTVQ